METQKILVALLVALIFVVAFQMIQISNLSDKAPAQKTATKTTSSASDDYAKMMKEHHGIDVNAQQSSAGSSGLENAPDMVGGC